MVAAADLAEPRAAVRLWNEAVQWRGHIDVLINNAGIYERARLEDDIDLFLAAWERTLAICLVSPATLCRGREFLPRAERRDHLRLPAGGLPGRGSGLLTTRREGRRQR